MKREKEEGVKMLGKKEEALRSEIGRSPKDEFPSLYSKTSPKMKWTR